MNKKILLVPAIILPAFAVLLSNKDYKKVDAYAISSLPHNITLKDNTNEEIRNYYSSLNSLGENELKGTNLLKNLKTILKNGQKYYPYESNNSIWQMYEITDRDWEKSPASAIAGYDSTTNTITGYVYGSSVNTDKGTNPYVHALYVNRNVDNQTKAWDDHNAGAWSINKEHVWQKSAGFNDDLKTKGGARGDPMHLVAGNGKVNQSYHNDLYYGYVDKNKNYKNASTDFSNLEGNLVGVSKTLGGTTEVFEPQDSDKGDIARILFYMAARYNYYSGEDADGIDSNNPNLEIVNDLTSYVKKGYASTTTTTGKIGVIQDLLEWNKLDPVDEYETHRNNLLFNNYTNNRNPFIDFPQWADYIWGTVEEGTYDPTPIGYARANKDAINDASLSLSKTHIELEVGEHTTVSATSIKNTGINWTISPEGLVTLSKSASASGEEITVTCVAEGKATIKASTVIDEETFEKECTVKQHDPEVTSITVSPTSEKINFKKDNHELTLAATVTGNYLKDKGVTWKSSDTSIATVDENGKVTVLAKGEVTITATSNDDASKSASCTIKVYEPLPLYVYIGIGAGVLLILIIVIVVASKNKKVAKRITKKATSYVKKSVGTTSNSKKKSSSSKSSSGKKTKK